MQKIRYLAVLLALVLPLSVFANEKPNNNGKDKHFQLLDVFQLEFAADPQISPDGKQIVYARTFMDIMNDTQRSNLWIINADSSEHRPLTSGNENHGSPRWSPDGKKLLYVSREDGSAQLYLRWMDTGQTAKLTNLTSSPGGLAWSPDGKWIALTMFVPEKSATFASMPPKPQGAKWADAPKYIDKIQYRADGAGYLKDGYTHIFILPAEGGTPRQLSSGDFNHSGTPSWAPDGKTLIFSANRHSDWQYDPANSEVYEISIADGAVKALTDRNGPDGSPAVSPDGKKIAYLGYDDQLHGYHVAQLYVMNRDGSGSTLISGEFDRDVQSINWAADGKSLYFQYDDKGNTKVASMSLNGKIATIAGDVGGLSTGRPYAGGQYSVAPTGTIAFTHSRPDHPADVAVVSKGGAARRLTHLNEDLFGHKELAKVEEIWYTSSFDNRDVQGWIAYPPGFDAAKKYPLLLEIHGGPFANYGDRFAAEIQLYAAAGYVVLYTNPRGSTSYGKEFGNLIHHNYPGEDYDDLMSGVDAVIAKGFIDNSNLFVTGGSGGGVLSSWIVGHTDRFRAAVVQKPVINWYSFVLTADNSVFFTKYWFPGFPWDHLEHYMKRSPLHYVGNVTTPTMLLTGEVDYRTPISESEQFYEALKLRKVDAALVRIPGASHGIARRPSQLIAKVAHVLKWFQTYRTDEATNGTE